MAIARWTPPTEPTRQEKALLKRCKKTRKLYAFLREQRLAIFDDERQDWLESMYRETGAGKEPVCPALMAMALILQGYFKVSDAEAVELTVVDLRWQMVLGCLGARTPAFSQGALFDFRERLIAHDMDIKLLEHTAAAARTSKGFDARKLPKNLRLAIDSCPLDGAGRVEDTVNLIGHAMRNVVKCVATLLDWEFERVCKETGTTVLMATSIKRALDRDWSDAREKAEAVDVLAKQVLSLERWLEDHLSDEAQEPPLDRLLSTLHEVMDQDLEPDPDPKGGLRIARGVAEDRRISIEDGQMRHGRKTKSKRIDGYKRHVATDLDSQAIVACAITPANVPEHEAFPELKAEIERQGLRFKEAHFDRGYMGSPAVAELEADGVEILCKPWKAHNGKFFSKDEFRTDLRSKTITCPAGQTKNFEFGRTVEFDCMACRACALRDRCTPADFDHGRTVSIAKNERLQKRLRGMSKTKKGRQRFRDRVLVEHSLAHIVQRQGQRARFMGVRKNLFDMRRAAIIQNLETAQRKAA